VLKSTGFLQCRKSGCYGRSYDNARNCGFFVFELPPTGMMPSTTLITSLTSLIESNLGSRVSTENSGVILYGHEHSIYHWLVLIMPNLAALVTKSYSYSQYFSHSLIKFRNVMP